MFSHLDPNVPRRAHLQKMVPAERAIYDAIQRIEMMPADVRLTEAQVLLGRAKDLVSDYTDEKLAQDDNKK